MKDQIIAAPWEPASTSDGKVSRARPSAAAARIVFDLFHIMKLAAEALDALRSVS